MKKRLFLFLVFLFTQFLYCPEDPEEIDTSTIYCDSVGGVCTSTPSYVCDPGFEPLRPERKSVLHVVCASLWTGGLR